jgi:aminopeptidase N
MRASGDQIDGIRAESATGAKQLREEVVTTLKSISGTMANTVKDLATAEKAQLEAFSDHIASLTKTSGDKLDGIRTEAALGAKQLREEVIAALRGIAEATTKTMGELATIQSVQLETMYRRRGGRARSRAPPGRCSGRCSSSVGWAPPTRPSYR